ncbi:hypothetical protein EDC04DRAFT_335684 [Pisolithus marmoratus]|nr:hypothetical protein EDC04DRAFT_335684 [Pisolithus marmoratus]
MPTRPWSFVAYLLQACTQSTMTWTSRRSAGAPTQNSDEAVGKPIIDDHARSVNTRVSDLATHSRRPSMVLDSEDEDCREAQRSWPATGAIDIQSKMLSYDPEPHISPARPSPRVRFRSRVRITAGVHRPRRLSDGLSSNASSVSGSPSSSISAPLRTHDDSYEGSKGWGPLGRRVSLLASTQARRSRAGARENASGKSRKIYPSSLADSTGERSHLYTGYFYTPVTRSEVHHRNQNVECEQMRRGQVINATFGEWPWRLLNRHWWWWQLEPILCCFYLCENMGDE